MHTTPSSKSNACSSRVGRVGCFLKPSSSLYATVGLACVGKKCDLLSHEPAIHGGSTYCAAYPKSSPAVSLFPSLPYRGPASRFERTLEVPSLLCLPSPRLERTLRSCGAVAATCGRVPRAEPTRQGRAEVWQSEQLLALGVEVKLSLLCLLRRSQHNRSSAASVKQRAALRGHAWHNLNKVGRIHHCCVLPLTSSAASRPYSI
eukprot:SAG11_NODE_117_length_15962_cov_71.527925_3_plen_204_part_00